MIETPGAARSTLRAPVLANDGTPPVNTGGRDAHDVRQVERAWVPAGDIDVESVVAGGDDEQRVLRGGECVPFGDGEDVAAERQVGDPGAGGGGILDRLHLVGDVACAIPVEHPQRQHARRPVDSGDALVVQTDRADDTGDMRAVTREGLVLRDRVVVDEVPAAVQTTGEIRVRELHTGVEDRHRVLGRADGQLPRGRHIDLQKRPLHRRYRARRRAGSPSPTARRWARRTAPAGHVPVHVRRRPRPTTTATARARPGSSRPTAAGALRRLDARPRVRPHRQSPDSGPATRSRTRTPNRG